MHPFVAVGVVLVLVELSFLVRAEGFDGWRFGNNATVLAPSPWLRKKVIEEDYKNWFPKHGCSHKSCRKGGEDGRPERKKKMKCCKNRCVDVGSDVNNCGFCGRRCSFPRQCCRGLCVNTNKSKFNCGKCGHKCPFRIRCIYGMCGYGQDPRRPSESRWKPPHRPKDRHRLPPLYRRSS
ncbi:stigma-specific STIG1-like protein 1 [Momordica charantia]|uniref:Stigma-specific STIG1-like protein 1 n=1 Tax=Momordica charantia TaxID=3673 RepID=A0A6J1CCX1_MOMCH|nr:stigma-specific STIG1-like protein 1 [Momordica charantia]